MEFNSSSMHGAPRDTYPATSYPPWSGNMKISWGYLVYFRGVMLVQHAYRASGFMICARLTVEVLGQALNFVTETF